MEALAKTASYLILQTLFTIGCIWGSPLSSKALTFSPSSSSSSSFSSSAPPSPKTSCQPTEIDVCSSFYKLVQMPNAYGDFSQQEAELKLNTALKTFGSARSAGKSVATFFCTLYIPPCPHQHEASLKSKTGSITVAGSSSSLPCQSMCQKAREDSESALESISSIKRSWPVRCQTLPNDNCYTFHDDNGIKFVQDSFKSHNSKKKSPTEEIVSFAPLDVELGGNGENFEIEVVSLTSGKVPSRRYDIADFGDPTLFQGWADVQGTGAANDYCRVVGKGKRRFLSCNLAGTSGQGHHYVSKLGFEVGHQHTWFMRDMDGDGRDDYCRCVGAKTNSKISCMKSGDKGFYGSTTQGGSQHSFTLQHSEGCHDRVVNAMFGE